jgi:hypothetical protein
MKVVELSVQFRDGEVLVIREAIPLDECERLLSIEEEVSHGAQDEALERIRRIEGWGSQSISRLWLSVDKSADLPAGARYRRVSDAQSVWGEAPKPKRGLASCRALLGLVAYVLPSADRRESLDEWVDDLECAVEKHLSIVRRTASILFRAAPLMAVRARGRARVRRRS